MKVGVDEIGFDFDGVIGDTAEAFIRIACQEYGYCSFSRQDITQFDLEVCLTIPLNIIEEIFTKIMADSVVTGLQPKEGSIETLASFTKDACVKIITARGLSQPVYDWLENILPSSVCSKIEVISTGDHNDKLTSVQNNKLKYFIDDRPQTCYQLAQAGIIPFVFTEPWNEGQHTFQTVSNWQEIWSLVYSKPYPL